MTKAQSTSILIRYAAANVAGLAQGIHVMRKALIAAVIMLTAPAHAGELDDLRTLAKAWGEEQGLRGACGKRGADAHYQKMLTGFAGPERAQEIRNLYLTTAISTAAKHRDWNDGAICEDSPAYYGQLNELFDTYTPLSHKFLGID